MPAKKHIHTYERSKQNQNYYRCIDPDCTHREHKDNILGKRAACRFCKKQFILDQEALRRKDARCPACRRAGRRSNLQVQASPAPERKRLGRPVLSPQQKAINGLIRMGMRPEDARSAVEKMEQRDPDRGAASDPQAELPRS